MAPVQPGYLGSSNVGYKYSVKKRTEERRGGGGDGGEGWREKLDSCEHGGEVNQYNLQLIPACGQRKSGEEKTSS